MGRYDRIRVYDGSSFRQPSEIKVFNGTNWVSLGTNNDTSAQSNLKVLTNGAFVTATKKYVTHPGETYTNNSFSLSPASGYCYCPNSSSTSIRAKWRFYCANVKKDDNVERTIFQATESGGSYVKLKWLANGQFKISTHYGNSSNTYNLTSDISVGAGNWCSVEAYQDAGSNTMYLTVNGVTKSAQMYGAFNVGGGTNQVGDWGMHFKGLLQAQGRATDGTHSTSAEATTLTSDITNTTWGQWE